jgi:hypothetical protein
MLIRMLLGILEDEDLQGSSRTVGGICRGRAMGNAPAFADMQSTVADDQQGPSGRVYLHVGEGVAPYSMAHPVSSDLPRVLKGFSRRYSPIRRENARISVQEDGVWELKGRFSDAMKMAESLPWVEDNQGKWTVTLQAEIPTSGKSLHPGSSAGSSLMPSVVPASDSTSLQSQILALLNIPEALTTRTRSGDLRLAYAKYKAVLQARSDMQKLRADGTWTLGKVSADTLIELFVSKTVWYNYHCKLFPQVAKYPVLKQWLDNEGDGQSSLEVWGEEKASYTFRDLQERLKTLEIRASKKKKEKRKLKEDHDTSKKRKLSKSYDDDGDVSM